MNTGNFVAYYRVSTKRQGNSGLGLEAQQKSVLDYLNGGDWKLVGEFTEVESGRKNERGELQKAFAACRVHNSTLIISKLDRLSRNAHFLLGLKEAGIDFICCDMPSANRMTVSIMAIVAEEEARMISERTKAALAAYKARGGKLGIAGRLNLTKIDTVKASALSVKARQTKANQFASDLMPIIKEIQQSGTITLKGIATTLNEKGITTARGKAFSHVTVGRIINR
jgi:DNA invertase Pin-like site-specific DNA recombinase